jgi:hypothetical protein
LDDDIILLRGMLRPHTIILTPPCFIEAPIASQEIGSPCICVFEVSVFDTLPRFFYCILELFVQCSIFCFPFYYITFGDIPDLVLWGHPGPCSLGTSRILFFEDILDPVLWGHPWPWFWGHPWPCSDCSWNFIFLWNQCLLPLWFKGQVDSRSWWVVLHSMF